MKSLPAEAYKQFDGEDGCLKPGKAGWHLWPQRTTPKVMVFVETHTPKFRLLEYCKLVMKVYKSSYFGKHLHSLFSSFFNIWSLLHLMPTYTRAHTHTMDHRIIVVYTWISRLVHSGVSCAWSLHNFGSHIRTQPTRTCLYMPLSLYQKQIARALEMFKV